MEELSVDRLNQDAMQIILHAGDARKMLQDAIKATCNNENPEEVDLLLQNAKKELLKAHNIQTEDIQESVTKEEQYTCLLFTHAQDTLMTINSEMLMVKDMITLHRKLEGEIKNVQNS